MTPQEALVAIVRERDIDALIVQPEMLRGHLMDYCRGGNRREFNLLVAACHSRVPQVLRAPSSSVLQADRIADLARRMVDDHGMADEHARWAVGTWALALGVSTAPVTDLRPSDPVRPPVPERVPDPAPDAKPSVTPPPAPALRRDIFLGIGGTAIIASGLTYLVTRGPSASSPATPTLAPTIPVPTRAPSLPTATAEPPTATRVPLTPTPGPRRLVVDAAGGGDYRTIASAILGARPQDTIVLRPGTYNESLTILNDVQIVGEGGRSKVIVEGASGASVFKFTAGSATLTGLTIRYTGPTDPAGVIVAISVGGGTPVIEDCDLTSSAGAAVYILGAGANPVIRNCTMRNSRDSGVVVSDQGKGTIERCVISGNGLSGVAIKTGGNPTVRDCKIRDGKGSGVYVYEQGQGTIERCVISGNGLSGVAIKTGGNPTVRDCEIRDNKEAGVHVYEQGQGTIERCVISGNGLSGVAIRTGGNPTVRDCEIRDNKESGVFVYKQGQGTIERCVISGNALSGVVIKTGGNPTVRDCEIRGNGYEGVWVYEQGQGTFIGNTLTGNDRGAWDIAPDAGRVTRTGNRPNA